MPLFTAVFLAALGVTVGTRLWLARRHVRHVLRHRDAPPPQFAQEISVEAHRKAADYSAAKTRLGMAQTGIDTAWLLLLTLGGLLQRLQEFWLARVGDGILAGIALIASVAVLTALVDLPLTWHRTFGIEARFGFNQMTPKLFVVDLVKHAFVAALFGIPLLFCVLWLMGRMGDWWWLYVWLAWMGFNVLALAVYPTFIAPLFNKFSPLADGDLKARIERLLAKCGFRSQGLFVMDGSKRSSHGNAYFTGFGRAKRIVFFDTLLARLEPAEVEAVLAHELGHFRLHHVMKRMAWTFAASLAFFWALGFVMKQPWFYEGLGVATPSTAMALLLFVLVAPLFTFLLQPLASRYSRKHEFEADQYAARHASATELKHALVKLYKDNASTLTPDPLHSAFYDSHPPAAIRIARLESHGAG